MAERGEPLSERELDVLRRLAAGESNKAIADGLSISPYTVKTHLRNIYAKLDVSTRTEAMTVALQQGLLTVPSENGEPHEMAEPQPAAVDTAAPDDDILQPDAPPEEAAASVSHRWRSLSLALVGLFLLVVGLFVYIQWREGALFATATADEPFAEVELGESLWRSSRPLPEPLAGRAVAAVGLDVYIIGGETDEGITDRVNVFDTLERVWERAASKPTAVSDATAVELFGEIYVPGGLLADGRTTAVVEAYSPTQNAWRRVSALPRPVAGALAVADGGFLYVFGGRDEDGPLDTAYVYDPGADSWRPLVPLPGARSDAAGGALTGLIYVVGGTDGARALDDCLVYEPAADAWDECPSMLRPHVGAGATVLLNKLYVIGGMGESSTAAADHGEVYDPKNQTWTVLNNPPGMSDWNDTGVTHVETRIYALGGRVGETLSDSTLIYSPLAFQTFIPAAPSDPEQ